MRNIILTLIALFTLVAVSSCRYYEDASDTAFNEVSASKLLKKYNYFKDVSASLDKKVADIQVYDAKIKSLEEQYKGENRKDWAREDREQISIWQSEVAGIKASYNSLAADYNSSMSKINYAFCNIGSLPQGAEQPLPREFKPYITE